MNTGFIAYPSNPDLIGDTIENAVEVLATRHGLQNFHTWRESNVAGQFIASRVIESLDTHNCLVADITKLNFNVTFEIGFAIGRLKPISLIKHAALNSDQNKINEIGIFDTIGYKEYENSSGIVELLKDHQQWTPIPVAGAQRNQKAPVYLIDALYKTDHVTRIIARVKKARLFFRSFDPNEQPRLSAMHAIENIAQSYGVLLHLIPCHIRDSEVHNLRVAFLAGLATGMGRVLLLMQDGDEPVPLDYRDLVVCFYHPTQIDEAVGKFAEQVTEAWQGEISASVSAAQTLLETINLGASSAENEFRELANYYLEIDAFQRAKRREIRIIVGRKGSGKTALFVQLRDQIRRNPSYVVLDLRPEGYQLLKFKDSVLNMLERGTLEHTITAFWEYLLLLEICRKILENDRQRHLRDSRLYEPYRRLSELYEGDEFIAEGDFSERMSNLLQRIDQDFQVKFEGSQRLSQGQLTELLYKHDVSRLRKEVIEYLTFKDGLWLLFDNLDKGWPPSGVKPEDIIIVRTLSEATRKIERELSKHDFEAHTIIFLRNDIFELLIDQTPDRGKEAKVGVDWTDADLLRELIRRCLVFNQMPANLRFEDLWRMICVSHIDGEDSFQYLVDRSLMRPRCLIDVVNYCRGCAVNLGHSRIESEDIRKGLSLFSTDLVHEISLEIRDVFPAAEDILYAFIDVEPQVTKKELDELFAEFKFSSDQLEQINNILIWYGVLGIVLTNGETEYIYSLNYDMRLLQGKIRKLNETGLVFSINPAFWPGLGIRASLRRFNEARHRPGLDRA